jgi:hypothetical protein
LFSQISLTLYLLGLNMPTACKEDEFFIRTLASKQGDRIAHCLSMYKATTAPELISLEIFSNAICGVRRKKTGRLR